MTIDFSHMRKKAISFKSRMIFLSLKDRLLMIEDFSKPKKTAISSNSKMKKPKTHGFQMLAKETQLHQDRPSNTIQATEESTPNGKRLEITQKRSH